MAISIYTVKSGADLKSFMDFQYSLYKDDPYWIAPIRWEMRQRLDPKKGFLRKNPGTLFLAKDGREIVGRLSVSHLKQQKDFDCPEGNFGFYEATDDADVAKNLLGAGLDWLKNVGMKKAVGPYNFRLEDPHPGFLAEGFDLPPYFMMAHSKPYYLDQMEASGFGKAMDLRTYELTKHHNFPADFLRKTEEASCIPGLRLRNICLDRIYEEANLIREIFNHAARKNWGHVPFSEADARNMAKTLRFILDPRIVFIAQVNERPVGIVINLPNYNELLWDCNGRIIPKGLLRFLLKKRNLKSLRAYGLAVIDEYQRSGLGSLLILESFKAGVKAGYERAEISWVLSANNPMSNLAESAGSEIRKVYRLYQRLF